jgi:hypothetical protein
MTRELEIFEYGLGCYPRTCSKTVFITTHPIRHSRYKWQGQSFGVSYRSGSTYSLVWQDNLFIDNIGVAGYPIECLENLADIFVKKLTSVDGFMDLSNASDDSERPVPQQT